MLPGSASLTASRLSDALAKTKTGWGASRANLMADLIAERLTGEAGDRFVNAAMQWGTDNEPYACDAYAFHTDADLNTVGFVDHPTIGMSGASPDRLAGADGLIEVKCPNTATHIETLLGREVPAKITAPRSGLANRLYTGRAWCDFVSFDPRLPEHMRLFVRRIHRDDAFIAELEREARIFLAEIDAKLAALTEACSRAA